MNRAQGLTTRGPERFRAPREPERAPAWRSVASALVLALLVLGVPVGLGVCAGAPPVPHHLGLDLLDAPLGLGAVLGLLQWVLWLAWLQLTVCTVVETVSAIRGRDVPAHVPLAGGMQELVRRLVASALLLGALGAPLAAAAPVDPGTGAGSGTAAVQVSDASSPDAPEASRDEPGTGQETGRSGAVTQVRYMLGDTELDPQVGAELVGRLVYVVRPPEGYYHDNLWDIALRSLGDGRAYQQIYELNVGRVQADGRSLELARLIQPYWLLVMPEGAQGVERVVEVPVTDPEPAPPAPAPQEQDTSPDQEQQDQPGQDAVPRAESVPGAQVPAVGALLAASVLSLLAYQRRRAVGGRPQDDATELERRLLVSADPERLERLDRILRGLGALEPRPAPYAVLIDDDACRLRLARPLGTAPQPWEVRDDGLTWVLPAGREPEPADAPPLLPGLAHLGRDDQGADVLVDLAAADGEIAVTGDPTAAAEVVAALALGLCTSPWSTRSLVTGAGLPAALRRLVGERLHDPEDLADLEDQVLRDGVLTGQAPDAAPAFMLVVGAQALPAPPPGRQVTVIRAGAHRHARWQVEVDSLGTAHIDPLDVALTASRATEEDLRHLVDLLPQADTPQGPRPAGRRRPPVPDPPRPPLTTAELRAAPVRLHVLGQVQVEGAGTTEPGRRDLLTEAALCVALNPGGIRPLTLGAMLWPLGVTSDVVTQTVRRLRAWLGYDPDGLPHLREDDDGRLLLGPGAVLDWDVLRSLLEASRTAGPGREAAVLLEALRLVRGPVAAGVPARRYSWLARVRTARQLETLVVDAAHRVVELLGGTDPAGAAQAVAVGLQVVDLNQVLWRDRLRLAAQEGTGPLAEAVQELLQAAGAQDLAAVDPATAALVEDLAPGLSYHRHSA